MCIRDRAAGKLKGQFLSPWDMKPVVEKAKSTGNADIMVCERGASFGYNNLVSDMRSLAVMRDTGCPVVFDATHSVPVSYTHLDVYKRQGTLAHRLYGKDVVGERHRHRYEFNNRYRTQLEDAGLVIAAKSMDDLLVEMICLLYTSRCV